MNILKNLTAETTLKRTLSFAGEVNTESIEKILEKILTIQRSDFSNCSEPIILHVHSGGGNLTAAIRFYETIRIYNINLTTVITGYCASAALLIFAAGKSRLISKFASGRIHQVGSTDGSRLNSPLLDDITYNHKQAEQTYITIIKNSIKKNKGKDFMKIYKNEKDSTASEFIDLGLAQKII